MVKESNLEFVAAVCERMQQVGLVASKAEFSEAYLGHGASYLSSMAARGRHVPDCVIETLRVRIEADLLGAPSTTLERQTKHLRELLDFIVAHQAAATHGLARYDASTGLASPSTMPLSRWTIAARAVRRSLRVFDRARPKLS